jgi:very-short-patch-repair endonuclease
MAPHSLVQEYLNRTEHLWGIVTNGLVLRLLRDSTFVRRQAYLEFDLAAILEEQRFQDFAALYRLLHRSRLPRGTTDAQHCLLEQYYQHFIEQGGRVRDRLRDGVEQCITLLANGFLRHPANRDLRRRVWPDCTDNDRITPEALYRQLLVLVYRFLFLLVSEDRGLLSADPLYCEHYSIGRLRRLLDHRAAFTEHDDLWHSLRVLWLVLTKDQPQPALNNQPMAAALGLPVLNGQLFEPLDIDACAISNRDLLEAFWYLAYYRETPSSPPRRVNYAALDVEELGSVYESLLEFHPQIETSGTPPRFDLAFGSERKSTGSYYTPPELVAELLRSALEPVLEERLKAARTSHEKERAVLSIRVCDPACGSGHFLLAAARRLGKELARIRTGEDEPAPERVREAIRDVVAHCIYGVDRNPLAVELCRVALWLESHTEGKPLTFLDHRIRCGDSLVGVAGLAVLKDGVPDDAFAPVSGDDKQIARVLKRRNAEERRGQQTFAFDVASHADQGATAFRSLLKTRDDTPAQIRSKKQALEQWEQQTQRQRMACHLWAAAFFQPFQAPTLSAQGGAPPLPPSITTETLRRYVQTGTAHGQVLGLAGALANRLRFFHWPLEFPEVFGAFPPSPSPQPSPRGRGGYSGRETADSIPSPSGTEQSIPSPSGRGQGEGLPRDLLAFARQLRRQQTDAEQLLWSLLRARRLGGWKFRRQHPLPPYILDFYCHELGLAIELDGGQHNDPSARRYDERRNAFLAKRGIKVLRFWNHEVLQDTEAVLEAIWSEAMARQKTLEGAPRSDVLGDHGGVGGVPASGPSPRPSGDPLPEGEGVPIAPLPLGESTHYHSPLPLGEGTGVRASGFDVILCNPPWERIKLQEEEFFATRDPRIANAPNKAARQRAIAQLPKRNPELWQEYSRALHDADALSKFLRSSGRYPLTARGDINTYSVFAELFTELLNPHGRAGVVVPTGIATDATNQYFFRNLVERGLLVSLYDFENRKKLFPAVDSRMKFCLLTLAGASGSAAAEFAFFCHQAADLKEPERRFTLTGDDFRLLNPNTGTAPIFRTRRDAELTKHIYRRVPVLVNEALTPIPSPKGRGEAETTAPSPKGRGETETTIPSPACGRGVGGEGGNPWGVEFLRMFDMANDSHLFRTREQLEAKGFCLVGNRFHLPSPAGTGAGGTLPSPPCGRGAGETLPSPACGRGVGGEGYLPLYEAKMIHQFNHRFGDYRDHPEGSASTQLPDVPPQRLADPNYQVLPRYWVPAEEVEARLATKGWDRGWLLGWRDITNVTNERTVIAAVIPRVGVGNNYPLLLTARHATPYLAAILSALPSDFVARQKAGGTHLNFFIFEQLPVLPPSVFEKPCPWSPGESLADWIRPRVLELTYTAWDLEPFARDLGYDGPPFRWDDERRFQLRCELDAAFFILYLGTPDEWEREATPGLKALFPAPRDAVGYILDQFPIVRRKDEERYGTYRTREVLLEMYDAMCKDIVKR